jgi:hypothetical protein
LLQLLVEVAEAQVLASTAVVDNQATHQDLLGKHQLASALVATGLTVRAMAVAVEPEVAVGVQAKVAIKHRMTLGDILVSMAVTAVMSVPTPVDVRRAEQVKDIILEVG